MEVRSLRRLLSSARGASWTRRADLFLVALAVLGLGIHTLTESTRRMNPRPYLAEKMGAATRAIRCFEAIREARLGTPSSQDTENDPEGSGLIGQEFTLTTTDRGVLEAKLTSVNPNFAAVFVEYFKDMGLERGDAVAIALTGSFPALNVTVLAAAEELGLRALPITSVGASMWGANDPSFTWLDMETLLNRQGLLATRSIGASIGGSNDRGRGLSPRGRALLREAIERNGVALIREPTLDESVKKRLEM
ncbi:MAG: poly-gamma-glutamate system protein, partial [Candidatus Eisenbacteria bacterium]|nr:poly-gamma-glutamate system protein [Candidatus Eisenbacteria bacterium]